MNESNDTVRTALSGNTRASSAGAPSSSKNWLYAAGTTAALLTATKYVPSGNSTGPMNESATPDEPPSRFTPVWSSATLLSWDTRIKRPSLSNTDRNVLGRPNWSAKSMSNVAVT